MGKRKPKNTGEKSLDQKKLKLDTVGKDAKTQKGRSDLKSTSFPIADTVIDKLSASLKEARDAMENNQDSDIPEFVSVLKFAQCRASEIATLTQEVKSKRKKATLQQLPHYMRRRQASHNAKRVPRRLRERVLKETEKAKKTKRPSRKHRRRPSNLLLEYNRRQKDSVWLETHIWFAKRFKMTKLWGYKIPLHPNDKSVRASYRALTQYALLQDLSYLCCIELCGPQEELLNKLNCLTDTSVGLTFASKMYLTGMREGNIFLYHPNAFPFQGIGPVSFLWNPEFDVVVGKEISPDTVFRQLWIWCHPSMHDELVNVLKTVFCLTPISNTNVENMNESDEKLVPKCEKEISKPDTAINSELNNVKLQDEKFALRFQKDVSFSGNLVKMTLLKDTLVRHRLLGPRSQSIIANVLKVADVSAEGDSANKWWEDYYSKNSSKLSYQKQSAFWNNVQGANSPDKFSAGVVVGLTVRDPRLNLPKARINVAPKVIECLKFDPVAVNGDLCMELASSPLWVKNIREIVTALKQPEKELNRMRSNFLVPGTPLELGKEECRIPVIVIQQPGVDGFGAGWDLICPLGWSMPFWISFIYHGARASGLRELRSAAYELGYPLFPFGCPDTESGKRSDKTLYKELTEKHYRYPPDKRPSFKKLGIVSPYFMPWETLVFEWEKEYLLDIKNESVSSVASNNIENLSDSRKTFYVFRMKKYLGSLQELCDQLFKLSKQNPQKCNNNTVNGALNEKIESFKGLLQTNYFRSSLLCIKLKFLKKGGAHEFSGIYLPAISDLKLLKQNPNYAGPVESVHSIPKNTDESQATECKKTQSTVYNLSEVGMPVISTIISTCDRKLIGYICDGNFSYFNGCGTGLGYCCFVPLIEILKMSLEMKLSPTVLVRAQNSFQYRYATVKIIQKLY